MVVCLTLTGSSAYLDQPLGGSSTLERVSAYVDSLSDTERVLVLSSEALHGLPARWEQEVVPVVTENALCDALARLTASSDTEILFAHLDQPFLNRELTDQMLARHRDYRADYTFADGYPKGLSPEIVSGRVVAHLATLAADEGLARGGLFPVVARDINRMDVETILSSKDHRMLRLELATDSRANAVVCKLLSAEEPQTLAEWEQRVESTRTLHRTLPRFVSVQVIEQEIQRVAYSPYPSMRDDVRAAGDLMEFDRFSQLVDMIESLSPEAVVHFSLWGELSLHPQAVALVRRVLESERLSVLLETSGVGWDSEAADELFSIDDRRLQLIVGLDTVDPKLYAQVRGDGFEEASAFADRAITSMGRRAHVQAVRSELTEPGLEAFYKGWKERTENIVIQKYDHFCKRLPQIRIGDLSPIDRFPCWHLQRDLHVLVDGTVPLCREDIRADEAFGNVFVGGLDSAWEAGLGRYRSHVNGDFEGLCKECDEYYTFSF